MPLDASAVAKLLDVGGSDFVPAKVEVYVVIGMTSNPLGMALCNGVIQTPSR